MAVVHRSRTARQTPQFTKDGTFDESMWTNSLYTSRLEDYYAKDTVVPMWIGWYFRDSAIRALPYMSQKCEILGSPIKE